MASDCQEVLTQSQVGSQHCPQVDWVMNVSCVQRKKQSPHIKLARTRSYIRHRLSQKWNNFEEVIREGEGGDGSVCER